LHQTDYNKVDEKEKVWKGFIQSQKTKVWGNFEHGKEIGVLVLWWWWKQSR
jgi:hypothetical protein